MGDEKRVLVLDRYDHKILINTLYEKRNELIKEKKSTDLIDEVLLKTVDAPIKKFFKHREKTKDESR